MLLVKIAYVRRTLERVENGATPLFLATLVLVFIQRAILADAQVDWDEELYYQIARGWTHGVTPYSGIFDHKPPMVYVVYMLTSWSNHLFVLRAFVAIALVLGAFWTFDALRRAGRISSRQLMFLVPALCCLLSRSSASGTNTELIYTPLVMLSFGSLLDGRTSLSAAFAAFALTIKYTALTEIFGLGLVYWVTAPDARCRSRSLVRWGALVILLSAVSYIAFYLYFRSKSVDLIDQIVFRNIEHARRSEEQPFSTDSGLREFLFITAATSIPVGCACFFRAKNRSLLIGALAWLLLSVGQACISRQYYSHYFYPTYLPLTLIWASLQLEEIFVVPLIIGLVVIESTNVQSNFYYLEEYLRASDEYRKVCSDINSGGYIVSPFMAGYRICGTLIVDKFVFPAFYFDEHFIQVSGSGGPRAFRTKLERGDITSVVLSIADQRKFQMFFDVPESSVRAVTDTMWRIPLTWGPKGGMASEL